MKASILIKICLSVLILPWISILASTPPIFSAHIKVGDYSKKAQKIAVSKGFKNVLIKATGNSNVINLHEIQDEIKNSENYVQSYNYKIIKSNSDKKELYLNVNFSSKEIKQLLENINQPTWDNKRPSVLIWLAVNNYKGNSFLIHDSNSIAKILKNDFENRGLNTLFPIGDLTDINNVSLSDFSSINLSKIRSASKRYDAKVIVVGLIVSSVKANDLKHINWDSKWLLLFKDQDTNWDISNTDLDDIFSKATTVITDKIANIDINSNNKMKRREILLSISNINNLQKFVSLMQYLKNLKSVKGVKLIGVTPTSAEVLLTYKENSSFNCIFRVSCFA